MQSISPSTLPVASDSGSQAGDRRAVTPTTTTTTTACRHGDVGLLLQGEPGRVLPEEEGALHVQRSSHHVG